MFDQKLPSPLERILKLMPTSHYSNKDKLQLKMRQSISVVATSIGIRAQVLVVVSRDVQDSDLQRLLLLVNLESFDIQTLPNMDKMSKKVPFDSWKVHGASA